MKKSKKQPKKKVSLIALGFNKKPGIGWKGYVNSDSVKDRWKQIMELLSENETTPGL